MSLVVFTLLDGVTSISIEATNVTDTVAIPSSLLPATTPAATGGTWVYTADLMRAAVQGLKAAVDAAIAAGQAPALCNSEPLSVSSATASAGTSDEASRCDHQHAHGNLAGGTLHSVAVEGLLGVTATAGFESALDKDETFAHRNRTILGTDWPNGFTAGMPYSTLVSGTAAANAQIPSESGRHGILQLQTGTTTTGRAGFATNYANSTLPGDGSLQITSVIRIPTLSTAGEEFGFQLGLADSSVVPPTECAIFSYNRLTDGVNFFAICDDGAAGSQKVDTGIVVTANQWYRFDIVINAGWTQTLFYIDGVLVATINSQVPNSIVGTQCMILKSAGTTSRNADVDLYYTRKDLTASR